MDCGRSRCSGEGVPKSTGQPGRSLGTSPAGGSVIAQAAALVEVVLVLAAAHVTCRAFKHFTALGRAEVAARLNFSLGWAMMLFAFVWLILLRRDLAAYGLAVKNWPREFQQSLHLAAVRTRIGVGWWWVAILAWFTASVVFGSINRPFGELAWLMAWQFSATALGEELFFRGYMQTRLNEVLARRWSVRGVRFGAGLIFTAIIFGLLHAFNTVDYFGGRYAFAWGWACSTMMTGLLFGLLREATGSVAPGILAHFLNNLFWLTVMPPGAWQWLSKPTP